MKRFIIIILSAGLLVQIVSAEKITEGFEDKEILKKMEIEGDVVISGDQFHGGKNALYVPETAQAIFIIAAENKFGTVNCWVYDSCALNKEESTPIGWSGPFFGLVNADGDKAVLMVASSKGVKPTGYATVFTGENQWFSKWWSGLRRAKAGWNKFTFSCEDEKTLTCIMNDEKEAKTFPEKLEFFNKGFTGIFMGGGKSPADIGKKKGTPAKKGKNEKAEVPAEGAAKAVSGGETFYLDDIEVKIK